MRENRKRRPAKIRIAFGAVLVATVALLLFSGCGSDTQAGQASGEAAAKGGDTSAVTGDYYLDLTDLGMKLTIYLRLGENGEFLFSNTPEFQVNKSAGTFQKSGEEYVMVFTSVNGEDKTVSDGLTGSFFVAEDGSLDFTSCDRIYYGSAAATTTSADNPGAKLIGVPIPEDYEAPTTDSSFTTGCYKATRSSDGDTTDYVAVFFEDSTYLLSVIQNTADGTTIESEAGRYGVSTTQLATEPEGLGRFSNEVVDEKSLKLSVPDGAGEERSLLDFQKAEEAPVLLKFFGSGKETGTETPFEAELTVFADMSFQTSCGDFTETGVLLLDSSDSLCKIYPDHPEDGQRGLSFVATVPAGSFLVKEDGSVTLEDFRIRRSESLNRDKCTFEAIREE